MGIGGYEGTGFVGLRGSSGLLGSLSIGSSGVVVSTGLLAGVRSSGLSGPYGLLTGLLSGVLSLDLLSLSIVPSGLIGAYGL